MRPPAHASVPAGHGRLHRSFGACWFRTLLAALLLASAGLSMAADKCPLIRPPGLTAPQVRSLVLAELAAKLQRAPEAIDATRTVKQLDGTENAILSYSFAALAIAEALGFDAIAAFAREAKAKGQEPPMAALTVRELQEIAVAAYASGTDAPPPRPAEGAAYALQRIEVRAPRPAADWSLLRCTGEAIVFQRRPGDGAATTTAVARLLTLPPFTNTEDFLRTLRSVADSVLPAGFAVLRKEVAPVEGSSVPCAGFRVAGASGGQPYEMQARFCYASATSTLGYAAMFGQLGPAGPRGVDDEALAFILGASPK